MLSSSLLWSVGSLAISSLVAPALATGDAKQSYQLQEDWHGKKFFEYFEFFDQPDPTNGFVTYVNQSYAQSSGLVDITESGSLYMGVDYQTKLSPTGPGRESVRIESKEFYREGLYLIDIKHMPGSVCGTWPAFWSVGPSWPEDGEIDIIEGVNKHDSNKIVLHTSGSCDVSGEHDMSGSMTSGECGEASGTIGCVVEGEKGSSGDPFNSQGGGVYAMEWTPEFIKIWFLPRSQIPASLKNGHPDTAQFGTPMAHLQGTCNFHERFTAQKFILNTAFCGDWAGGVFGDSGCPVSDPSNPMQSCVNYVAENPAAFKDAYWEINSIKRFELGTYKPEKPEKPETTSVVQVASTSTANGAAVTSIESAISVSISKDGKSTSMTQVIENTSIPETQRTEAPVVPSNTADVEPTKVPQHTEGPKHTDAPSGGSGAGSGSTDDDDQDQQDGDDEAPQRSTVWITSTSTYCPKTKGGSIGTAPPVPAKPSTEGAVAVPSAPGTSQAEDKTVPVVVPTAPAATEPAHKPTGVSPEGQTPDGKTPGSKHPEDETPEGSSGQSSIEVKPPTAATTIPVGSTRPALPITAPSSSGFVPVPTHAGGVPHGTTGSAPSATTPNSPVFTGAATSLSIGLTGVMGVLAMALFA